MAEFTHFNESGRARMVDVSAKPETDRLARASALVRMKPETLALIRDRDNPTSRESHHAPTLVLGIEPKGLWTRKHAVTNPRFLAATWTMTRHWQFFLAVDNLFDTAYEEFIGFLAPGVSPRGGVRASF